MSGSQSQPGGTHPESSADPSMEDILASIRRILSEEDVPAGVPAPPSEVEPPQDVLILDRSMLVPDAPRRPVTPVLSVVADATPSHVVEEAEPSELPSEPVMARVAPAVAPVSLAHDEPEAPFAGDAEPHAPEPPDVHLTDPPFTLLTESPVIPLNEPLLPTPADPPTQSESPVMSASLPSLSSEETAAAAAGSVTNLVRALVSDRSTQVHSGGPTVADLVREELRPMLKAWLDSNLPPLVERLVRAEIERVIARTPG
jgi:cell pole-organizing protein PopZ